MKLSDFIKKYGDCEVTEEMEKCIKKKGKWMPEKGNKYWYVLDTGNYENVKAEVALKLAEKIKRHPKLWKLFFMVA